MNYYITYIKEVMLIILISLIIGKIVIKITKLNNLDTYAKKYIELLIGITALTVSQAIISTKFNTVLLIVPFLLAMGYYFDIKNIKLIEINKEDKKEIKHKLNKELIFLKLIIFTVIVFTINYFKIFEKGEIHSLREASIDLTFYSRCADYIRITGNEVCNNDYLFPLSSKPYHFSDIWFNSVISNINGNNTLLSLVLTFKVIYLILILFGIIAIIEKKYKIDYKIIMISTLTLYWTPSYIYFYDDIKLLSEMRIFAQTFDYAQKLFFIQLFLIATIILENNKFKKLAVATLLCLPSLYTVTLVPVYLSFALYIGYIYVKQKKILYDELIMGIISALYILIFYYVINQTSKGINPYEIKILEIINLKYTINIIGGTIIKHSLLYLPIAILLVTYMTNKNKKKFIYTKMISEYPLYINFLGMPIFGLFFWSIMSGDINSVQLFQNIAMPVFYLATVIILIVMFINSGMPFKIIISIFLIFNAGNEILFLFKPSISRSNEFIEEISKRKIFENNIYVTYRPHTWFQSIFNYSEKGNNLGNYSAYLNNKTQPVSLDIFEVPKFGTGKIEEIANKNISISTFYKYVENKKKQGVIKKYSDYQSEFIIENNIKILVTLNSVKLPAHLERLVVERIEDDISKEVVCILDY
jgi:hypothetical protein